MNNGAARARSPWTATTGAIACLALQAACTPGPPPAARATAGTQIIAFGDSLVEGVGATSGHDFVARLAARLGVPIRNAGRRGDTTSSALARLDQAVLSQDPRVVLVLLGGNDFLRRVPLETTRNNLATIVGRIRERGAAVVLVAVDVDLIGDSYGAMYAELGREMSAAVVPDILGDIMGRPERMSDAIHPNDEGHALMAERLAPVLRDLLE